MTYKKAYTLHNEDEVTVKETGEILTVIDIEVNGKNVLVECDDGNVYHHRDIE